MTVKKPLVINQPEVGNLIRELRLAIGLTQEQFAAVLGVTYPTVNRWERGRAKPSPMAMKLIKEICQWKDNIAVWHAYASNCFRQHYAFNASNSCRFYIQVRCIEMYQPKN